MKKIVLFFASLFLSVSLFAVMPEGFSWDMRKEDVSGNASWHIAKPSDPMLEAYEMKRGKETFVLEFLPDGSLALMVHSRPRDDEWEKGMLKEMTGRYGLWLKHCRVNQMVKSYKEDRLNGTLELSIPSKDRARFYNEDAFLRLAENHETDMLWRTEHYAMNIYDKTDVYIATYVTENIGHYLASVEK